jgi:hypothetical protein
MLVAEALAAPVIAVASVPATPAEWLQEFNMERYAAAFEQNGYDTLHLISVIDDGNLDALGITIPAHRKLFTVKVKELCGRLNH